MKYYLKFLGNDRQPCHGGRGQWPEPLTWTETIENPIPCKTGYHLCRLQDRLLFYNPKVKLWEFMLSPVGHIYD